MRRDPNPVGDYVRMLEEIPVFKFNLTPEARRRICQTWVVASDKRWKDYLNHTYQALRVYVDFEMNRPITGLLISSTLHMTELFVLRSWQYYIQTQTQL